MYLDQTLPTSDSHCAGTRFAKAILFTVIGGLQFYYLAFTDTLKILHPAFRLETEDAIEKLPAFEAVV
jgi:hypothetical protein